MTARRTGGDTCPNPPGATDEGCFVTGRVSKLVMGDPDPGDSVSALSPQYTPLLFWNMKYAFTGWSDGGARTHKIVAQADATQYRATHRWCWLLNPC